MDIKMHAKAVHVVMRSDAPAVLDEFVVAVNELVESESALKDAVSRMKALESLHANAVERHKRANHAWHLQYLLASEKVSRRNRDA